MWLERIEGIIDDLIKAEIVHVYPVPMCFSTFPSGPSYVRPEFKLYPEGYKNPWMGGLCHNQICFVE